MGMALEFITVIDYFFHEVGTLVYLKIKEIHYDT